MKSMLESFAIALCGLATSVLVALANVAIARKTGADIFTLAVWVVVPVGALLVGFAAASGYYLGSRYFHKRASASLLLQMLLIAAFTQFLIYWTGYATMVLEDGRKVADLVPFGAYMELILTKSHYRIGRALSDVGEVGRLGYGIAALHFLGLLAGSLAVFLYLKEQPVCEACSRYLRSMANKTKRFADADSAGAYYDRLFAVPVDGPDFAALIQTDAEVEKVEQGALQVHTTLLGCPVCKAQMIEEKVQGYNGQDWKDLHQLHRKVRIAAEVDLVPVFRG